MASVYWEQQQSWSRLDWNVDWRDGSASWLISSHHVSLEQLFQTLQQFHLCPKVSPQPVGIRHHRNVSFKTMKAGPLPQSVHIMYDGGTQAQQSTRLVGDTFFHHTMLHLILFSTIVTQTKSLLRGSILIRDTSQLWTSINSQNVKHCELQPDHTGGVCGSLCPHRQCYPLHTISVDFSSNSTCTAQVS